MKRYQLWQTMCAILFLTGTFVGCPGGHRKRTPPVDAITRDNSPQYAKDYDSIDSLHVFVGGGYAVGTNGQLEFQGKPWELELRPQEAATAHQLLRDLLHDYPLSQSFRGTQTRFRTAQDITIAFHAKINDTRKNVFNILVFTGGPSYMEIHYRIGVQGSGASAVPVGLAGTEVTLRGPVKEKLYRFLADCAAKAKEKKGSP